MVILTSKIRKVLKAITRHIPNTITSLNLLSGCVAIVFALQGKLDIAAYCVFAAAAFDFFDGMSARALNAYSPLGLQLDSLADVVSFGVAPSAMLYYLLNTGLSGCAELSACAWMAYLGFFPFIIAVFSALRLAKFNIDTRQTESFLGLPTPANGLLIASASASSLYYPLVAEVVSNPLVIVVASVVLSGLLVCEIPMFSLKFKKQENASAFIKKYSAQLMFLFLCLVSPFFFGLFCVAAMMILYIVLSVFRHVMKLLGRREA